MTSATSTSSSCVTSTSCCSSVSTATLTASNANQESGNIIWAFANLTKLQPINLSSHSNITSTSLATAANMMASFQNLNLCGKDTTNNETFPKIKLFTTKYTDMASIDIILTIWKKIAQERLERAAKLKLSYDALQLACCSQAIISGMRVCEHSVLSTYITYDANNRVQAIAYVNMAKPYVKIDTEIVLIATHPNNIAMFDDDKPTRGAGTALVKHIVLDTIKNNVRSGIHLNACKTSIQFYKKIGFTRLELEDRISYEHVLETRNMQLFLDIHKDAGIVVKVPPENIT